MAAHSHLPFVAFVLAVVSTTSSSGEIQLTDVTNRTGISFRHTDGSSGKHFIVEYVSAGLALFDYDRDGDTDIYFLNGAPMPGSTTGPRPKNALYRNDGDWHFTDVTDQAGVGDTGHGLGVVVGDYDNDGYPDIYLNNYGPNVLYRNVGDGTFEVTTKTAGVANGNKVGAGACFLDVDADGDLDLYVANYVKFSFDKHVARTKSGYAVYGSPLDYQPEPDTLFENNGDGTFRDISVMSGIANQSGYGMGVVCCDIDSDHDTDVVVGNDTGANFLFQNDGRGTFKEIGLLSGFAYDRVGGVQGTMGVDCGDFDNDGKIDIHVTSYQNEPATLYRNLGDGFVEDVTNRTGVGVGTSLPVTWGNGFVDLDNDGDRDVFVACGHLYDNVELFDDQSKYQVRNMVFENRGNGRFVDVSNSAGSGMQVARSSRGAAFDDLDNDGDIDVVILNSRTGPTILRNDSTRSSASHWLKVQLTGRKSNRNGIGARVKVTADGVVQVDEVHAGRGYQGHFGAQLHFGLGSRKQVESIRVDWIGGGTTQVQNVRVDQLIEISEAQE